MTICTSGKLFLLLTYRTYKLFLRGWKSLFEVDMMIYSPYYPFKDHDALCMTVRKADGSSMVKSNKENQELKKHDGNMDHSSIYPGSVIIN